MSNRLRDLPELTSSNLAEWARAVKEALQTFRGYRGDPLDRALTKRDLTPAGLAALGSAAGGGIVAGGGGTTIITPPPPDLTPPPTPTGLAVTAGLSYLYVSCDTPLYVAGGGHDRTVAYGVKWPTGGIEPTFSSAVELFQFQGAFGAYPTDTGSRWKVWIKWRSIDGVLSSSPAGSANGVEATTGKVGNADLGPLIVQAGNLAAGAVDATKFVSAIEPVAIVLGSLPITLSTRTIFLVSDGKLYRWNGTAYVATLATTDLTGTIADAQIAAIGAAKITGTLTDAQIADLAAAKLTGTIVETQIANDAITTPKIFAGAITTAKIAADAVTANEIAANAITAAKINAGAVTAAKIAANTITAGQIAANTITAGQIAAATITTAEIAADAITAGQIAAGAITAGKIAANAIAVGSAAIQNGAIVNAMIANATIDSAKIASLSAAQLTVGDGTVGGNLKSTIFTAGVGSTPGAGWLLTPAGTLHATGVVLYGTIYASAGVFAGSLSAATGSFSGNVTGTVAGTSAATLLGTANTAASNASSALTNAASAQLTANTGVANAATAQSTADSKLNKAAADVLTGTISLAVSQALYVGTVNDGVYFGSTGIVGRKAGANTFVIAADGTATFSGALSAATGSFSGTVSVGTSPAVSGTTMTGTGGVINAAGSFALGTAARNIAFNGTDPPRLNGDWVVTENIAPAAVTDSKLGLTDFTASIPAGDLSATVPYGYHSYGSRSVSVSGGVAPYAYFWIVSDAGYVHRSVGISGGATSSTVSISGSGDGHFASAAVTCLVRDTNGRCTFATFIASGDHAASGEGGGPE